jgi:hypothetical protein
MPTPITSLSMAQICDALMAIRSRLRSDSQRAVDRAIAEIPVDAFSLVFTELTPSTAAVIRADAVYRVPTTVAPGSDVKVPPRWLVYPTAIVPTWVPTQRPFCPQRSQVATLTDALNVFHFFEPLRAIHAEISAWAPDAARRLEMLQSMRQDFTAELYGHEFSMVCAVAVGVALNGALDLELALDHDDIDPDAIALETSCVDLNEARHFVVLGNDLETRTSTLLHSLQRA